ncbi:MAG: FAD-dependent oxidoreductase, partial [Verrucomicrobiaceae bacterium]
MQNSSDLSRRKFLHAALAGSMTVPLLGQEVPKNGKGIFGEPPRDLKLVEDADVIVCGAGPAGVSAAIAAARSGAKVRLFDVHGCLGGVWTAGLLTWIFDFDKPGLTKEIRANLDERGARRGTSPKVFVYEPDEMKLLLEDMCTEAGVKFRLQTRV